MTALGGDSAREKGLDATELQEAWAVLSPQERLEGLHLFPPVEAEDFLMSLPARDQADLLFPGLGAPQKLRWHARAEEITFFFQTTTESTHRGDCPCCENSFRGG